MALALRMGLRTVEWFSRLPVIGLTGGPLARVSTEFLGRLEVGPIRHNYFIFDQHACT